MKRILSIVLILTFCLSLAACGNTSTPPAETPKLVSTPAPELNSTPTPRPTPEPTPEPEPEIEIISEQLVLKTNGDTYIYLCEFINPCDFAISISDISIDLEDAGGNLLSVSDYVSSKPSTIAPGGHGYICEQVLNANFDTDVDINAVAKAVLHYDVEKDTYSALPVEITSVSLGTKTSFPNVLGRVKNTGDKDLTFVYISFPVYSADGILQTVITAFVDVEAGEEVSFEQMGIYADYQVDYSASYLGDPVIYPLF